MAKVNLTPGRIASFACTSGQSFLWDSMAPGLGVRATPGGKTAFILQSRFGGKPIRITIGDTGAITLADARQEARRLTLLIEQGIDPREQKRQIVATQNAAKVERERQEAEQQVLSALVADVWAEYIEDRRPRWSERHYLDHIRLSQAGGAPVKRGAGVLQEGPLYPLMRLHLADLTPARVESWLTLQIAQRPTVAALSLRLLKAFLNWCAIHDQYKLAVGSEIITRRTTAILPKKQAKTDCLMKEQLPGWFEDGLKAVDDNLKHYGEKRGIDTLAGVINTWSPQSDGNDTKMLIENASRVTGLKPDQKIDLKNPAVRAVVAAAIIRQEGSQSYLTGIGRGKQQDGEAPAKSPVASGINTVQKPEQPAEEKSVWTDPNSPLAGSVDFGEMVGKPIAAAGESMGLAVASSISALASIKKGLSEAEYQKAIAYSQAENIDLSPIIAQLGADGFKVWLNSANPAKNTEKYMQRTSSKNLNQYFR